MPHLITFHKASPRLHAASAVHRAPGLTSLFRSPLYCFGLHLEGATACDFALCNQKFTIINFIFWRAAFTRGSWRRCDESGKVGNASIPRAVQSLPSVVPCTAQEYCMITYNIFHSHFFCQGIRKELAEHPRWRDLCCGHGMAGLRVQVV